MNWFKQCIDCVHEARWWSDRYNGRSWIRTWHRKGHKKHLPRDGYTFFKDETFIDSFLKRKWRNLR